MTIKLFQGKSGKFRLNYSYIQSANYQNHKIAIYICDALDNKVTMTYTDGWKAVNAYDDRSFSQSTTKSLNLLSLIHWGV